MKPGRSLRFQTIDCIRCGSKRVLGVPCQHCGKAQRPSEVNSFVVSRRTAVSAINRELSNRRSSSELPPPRIPTADDLVAFTSSFTTALASFLETDGDTAARAALVEAVDSIEQMSDECRRELELRPHITLYRATRETIELLRGLWPLYSKSLTAASLLEAQEHSARGQRALDAAGAPLGRWNDDAASARRFEIPIGPDQISETLAVLLELNPGKSLIEISRMGASRAELIVGASVEEGHGAQFLILQALAQTYFDPARFERTLATSSQLCRESMSFARITESSDAVAILTRSNRLLFEALASFEAILTRETNEDALFRRLLKFYADLYEDVAAPTFAWYLLVADIKTKPYEKLLEGNATDLFGSLQKSSVTSDLFLGADAYLRNGAQHGSAYSLEGEWVQFKLRSFSGRLRRVEIYDALLAFLESLAATMWSLSHELSKRGLTEALPSSDADYMHMGAFRMARLSLQFYGVDVEHVQETSESWFFQVAPDTNGVFALAVVTATQNVPSKKAVTITRGTAGTASVTLALDDYRRFSELASARPPEDHLLALLKLRSSCMTATGTMLLESDVEFAVCTLGIYLLTGNLKMIAPLRAVLLMAKAANFREQTRLIAQVFSGARRPEAAETGRLRSKLIKALEQALAPEPVSADSVTVLP